MPSDVDGKLNHANSLLKAGKVGVRIVARGDRLALVATLPPKPESTKPYPHQQRIALGYRLNYAGIDKAVRDARVLSAKLIEGNFNWSDYIEGKKTIETFDDAIDKFKDDYITKRLSLGHDALKINQTLSGNFLKYLDRLDKDKPFNVDKLASELTKMPHNATRRAMALAYSNLADCVGVEHDLRSLKGGYSYKSVNPKDIPDDDTIAKVYQAINSRKLKTVYGLMAVYGLRNYEVFRLDLSDFPVIFVNKGKTKEERLVYPLYPEWVDWLTDMVMPNVNLERPNVSLGNDVAHLFYRGNIAFSPYCLRHAWARRSMEFGWDLTLAAKQMGHTVKVHSDVYHAWLSQDVYDKAYQQILDNPNRPKPPL
jgi:integrase